MNIFAWLENLEFAHWVGESLYGYQIMLSLHAIGLATVVGILLMVNLRVLGAFEGMPYQSLRGLMKLAWVGFVVNLLSGFSLFTAQATSFVAAWEFLIKIAAIFVAIILTGILQNQMRQNAADWDRGETLVTGSAKVIALVSIMLWSVALIAGRLTAYALESVFIGG